MRAKRAYLYTASEKRFIIEQGMHGRPWIKILDDFNRTFRHQRTLDSIRGVFYTSLSHRHRTSRLKWRPVSPTSFANGDLHQRRPIRAEPTDSGQDGVVNSSSPEEEEEQPRSDNAEEEANGDEQQVVEVDGREGGAGSNQYQHQHQDPVITPPQRVQEQIVKRTRRPRQRRRDVLPMPPLMYPPVPDPNSGSSSSSSVGQPPYGQRPLPTFTGAEETVRIPSMQVAPPPPSSGNWNGWVTQTSSSSSSHGATRRPDMNGHLNPATTRLPPITNMTSPPSTSHSRPGTSSMLNPHQTMTTPWPTNSHSSPHGAPFSTTTTVYQRPTVTDFASQDHQSMRLPPLRSENHRPSPERLPSLLRSGILDTTNNVQRSVEGPTTTNNHNNSPQQPMPMPMPVGIQLPSIRSLLGSGIGVDAV